MRDDYVYSVLDPVVTATGWKLKMIPSYHWIINGNMHLMGVSRGVMLANEQWTDVTGRLILSDEEIRVQYTFTFKNHPEPITVERIYRNIIKTSYQHLVDVIAEAVKELRKARMEYEDTRIADAIRMLNARGAPQTEAGRAKWPLSPAEHEFPYELVITTKADTMLTNPLEKPNPNMVDFAIDHVKHAFITNKGLIETSLKSFNLVGQRADMVLGCVNDSEIVAFSISLHWESGNTVIEVTTNETYPRSDAKKIEPLTLIRKMFHDLAKKVYEYVKLGVTNVRLPY